MTTRFKWIFRKLPTVGVALLLLSCCVTSHAQVLGGVISGRVLDVQSKPIASAEITITNSATGVAHTSLTNADGLYSVANLNPGVYTETAGSEGFSTSLMSNISVSVSEQLQINFNLRSGDPSEKVVIKKAQPAVDLSTSSMGVMVAQTTIHQLPLNGRDWTSLAALREGVAPVLTQAVQAISNQRANRGLGEQLAISGARPQWNNYRVDGISIEDYSNGGPGSVLGNNSVWMPLKSSMFRPPMPAPSMDAPPAVF